MWNFYKNSIIDDGLNLIIDQKIDCTWSIKLINFWSIMHLQDWSIPQLQLFESIKYPTQNELQPLLIRLIKWKQIN
jgi:hypothetical protein